MQRRGTIESSNLLVARLIVELLPPVFDPFDDSITVPDNLRSRRAGSFSRRNIGVIDAVFHVVDSGFEKSFTDAKNVMAHKPDRALTIIDHPLDQTGVRNLLDITLGGSQDTDPFRQKYRRRQRRVPSALHANKLGDILEILTKNVLPRAREHRHSAHPELEQLLPARGIVDDIDGAKQDLLFRKKLFRSETAASARLGKQNKRISEGFHYVSPLVQIGRYKSLVESCSAEATKNF